MKRFALVVIMLLSLMTLAAPAWAVNPGCVGVHARSCNSNGNRPPGPSFDVPELPLGNNPPPIGCEMPGWEQYAECNPPWYAYAWANYGAAITALAISVVVLAGGSLYWRRWKRQSQ